MLIRLARGVVFKHLIAAAIAIDDVSKYVEYASTVVTTVNGLFVATYVIVVFSSVKVKLTVPSTVK